MPKVLVVGSVNKYQQTLLDKMQECGYEIVYEDITETKGLEFDFVLVDELADKVQAQFEGLIK